MIQYSAIWYKIPKLTEPRFLSSIFDSMELTNTIPLLDAYAISLYTCMCVSLVGNLLWFQSESCASMALN